MMNTMTDSPLVSLMAPLNQLLAPAIRLGVANPWPFSTGFILLEVPGRRSGLTRTVPLLCTDHGSSIVVSTVRNGSQWIRNLAASPDASVWLRGRRRHVSASVYQQGMRIDSGERDEGLQDCAATAISRATGISMAILKLD